MPISGKIAEQFARSNGPRLEPLECKSGMYFLQFVDVNEAPPTALTEKYGPSWIWEFVVADNKGKVFVSESQHGPNGENLPLTLRTYTSDKTGKVPGTN